MIPPNLALLLWVLVVIYLFKWLPSQWAIVISFVGGYLFLPQFSFSLPLLIPGTRMAITTYAVLLGLLFFDTRYFKTFRLHWLDLPILVFCTCPFITSLTNGLGPFDGFKEVMAQAVSVGIPYILGRLWLGNLEGLRKFAITIFAGGVVYIPFCWFENVKGPMSHLIVYGMNAFDDWTQARRWGGWRPVVFLNHGLEVGLFMMAAALVGIWLWRTEVIKNKFWGMPVNRLVPLLIVTFLAVKSTGAWLYMFMGLAVIFTVRSFRTAILLFVLMIIVSTHLYASVTGTLPSDQIVGVIQQSLGEDRAGSIEYRFINEEILKAKASERIVFGWGGSGRSRVKSPIDGSDTIVTDSRWIIIFGINGMVGIVSWVTVYFLPLIAFWRCYPPTLWSHPKVAPAAILVVIVALFMLDNLLNAPNSILFTLMCGAISGSVMVKSQDKKPSGVDLRVAERYLKSIP